MNPLSRPFGLEAAFLHDSAKPGKLLRSIRAALQLDGHYVCLEINAAETLEQNAGPLGSFLYGFSALITAVFESREAYWANAQRPEQDARYRQWLPLLEGEPEWHDGEIDVMYAQQRPHRDEGVREVATGATMTKSMTTGELAGSHTFGHR